ncbi:flavodoxin [Niallia sp. Krafla_26]|uniref:flavodoxin n=1 Tax=Niallia sp. Krafla_26 TaxID=3064703 RepID=UPI003D16DA96
MKTIIVYASMTGTTELMAQTIMEELTKAGDRVVLRDVFDAYAEELETFESVLIGSYTWGDGDLSDEILAFHEELSEIDLTGKLGAVFGPGDSTYEHFARAVDRLEETLENQGCNLVTKGLKVDSFYEDEEEIQMKCRLFAEKLISERVVTI